MVDEPQQPISLPVTPENNSAAGTAGVEPQAEISAEAALADVVAASEPAPSAMPEAEAAPALQAPEAAPAQEEGDPFAQPPAPEEADPFAQAPAQEEMDSFAHAPAPEEGDPFAQPQPPAQAEGDPFAQPPAPEPAPQPRQQRGGMSGMDLTAIVQEAEITTEEAADSGDWATAWEVEQDLRGRAEKHATLAKQRQEEAAEQLRAFAEEKATRLAKARATNR